MTQDNQKKKSISTGKAPASNGSGITTDDMSWIKTSGFHPQTIPWLVIGALIGPFIVQGLIDQWFYDSDGPFFSITGAIIGIPIGALFGYAAGLGAFRNRLKRQQWARKIGWTYNHKQPLLNKCLKSAKDIKHASIYWHHARKSFFMTRRVGDRGACIHTASYQKGKHIEYGTFLFFDAGTDCPDMVIHTHHLGDKLSIPGTMKTVEFESNEFNKKWTVKAKNPKEAYSRLNQKALEYLWQGSEEYSIEFKGGLVIFLTHSDSQWMRIEAMRYADGFAKAVPNDLLAPYDFGPAVKGHHGTAS